MKHKTLKVMTILGTRPEIIRLSRVMAILDKVTEHVTVHTGQNYDYELNEVFYKDLEIKKPNYYLEANNSSLGAMIGSIITASEKVMLKEKPDAVLILGDTNSSMAGIMARRLKIPLFHMEAGNRCFDLNVPEETNRRIIDHVSDINLVYTEHARRNLLREGLHPRKIYLTGSPMKEVLEYYLPKIKKSLILKQLKLNEGKYFLVSTHREENVDNPQNLKKIVNILNAIAQEHSLPIIVSTHPRTAKRLETLKNIKLSNKISFLKPFGFFDYVKLQMSARCVISDSGTISEESSILNSPAITIRNSIERPESMDTGSIIVTGLDENTVLDSIKTVIALNNSQTPEDYKINNTAQRVAKLIIGTARLIHKWDGVIVQGR